MQSTSNTTMFINGKIEFHGVKSVYAAGERVQCFFTVPEQQQQPQSGDWIGIYPVGWSSLVRDCHARQYVTLGGQYGQIEFEYPTGIPAAQTPAGQYYQFVYVRNGGEYVILGESTPFRFGGEQKQQQQQPERYTPKTMPTGGEWFNARYGGVEGEIQKLQHEIYSLEQGLTQQQQWTTGKLSQQGSSVWQPKMVKIEQILKEKVRLEQAQRRLEQLCLLAQLKSCERHIVNVQKREQDIHSFYLNSKMQAKIAAFEQKVNQVVKMTTTTTTTTTTVTSSTPVEQYVRRYEQLLREKIQLDMETRRTVLHKLRQNIRECERKLRDLQTVDQEYLATFHHALKTRLGQFYATVQELELTHGYKHFETVMGSFLFEQEKKTMALFHSQRELTYLINDIAGRLQELEFESGCYMHLRIPRISTGLMFNSHPKLAEICQLEKKIAEQKLKLKLKMLAGGVPTRFVEQLARGEWFGPVVQHLRTVQVHLAKLSGSHGFWATQKTGVVSQFIELFTQYQTEAVQVVGGQQQSLFGLFEHIKNRQVLSQLRELKERECMEIIRYFQQNFYGQSPMIIESVQQLIEIIGEKMVELTAFNNWQQQPQHQQKQVMPVEWLLTTVWGQTTGTEQTLPELFEIERKLVEMKAYTLVSALYTHLIERLAELEQFVGCEKQVEKRERLAIKIQSLKRMVEQHIEQYTPSIITVPEQYFEHQKKYETMCMQVAEVECHFIEQVSQQKQYQPQQQQYYPYQQQQQQTRYAGIELVHQKFFRLVQQFQIQFPECFSVKIEETISFLRNTEFAGVRGGRVGQLYFQELKEKLVEFETILSQPECEIACLTTSLFPQSTTTTMKAQRDCLKHLIREVRELKHEVHFYLSTVDMMIIPEKKQQQQPKGSQYGEDLINLFQKNMWFNMMPQQQQQQQPQHSTKTTIVKSVSMPVNGSGLVMKPIEKLVRMQEEQQLQGEGLIFGQEQEQQLLSKVRFGGASFDLVDEYDEDEEDFDFGTDAEITISTLLANGHQQQQQQQQHGLIERIEMINGGEYKQYFGGEQKPQQWTPVQKQQQQPRFVEVDSCLCQHIRKAERLTTESFVCPLCTVETTTTTGVVRKF